MHLQRNQKVTLANKQALVIAQELGVNRYERITSPSLKQAEVTMEKTGRYWKEVRSAWQEVYANNKTFSLKAKVDGKKLFQYHFEYAAQLEKQRGPVDIAKAKTHAQETIQKFLIKDKGEAESKY